MSFRPRRWRRAAPAPLEQAPLGVVVDQRERAAIGGAGFLRSDRGGAAARRAPRAGSGALEGQAMDDRQARLGTVHVGDGNGPI